MVTSSELRSGGALLGDLLGEGVRSVRDVHEAVAGRVFGALSPTATPVRRVHDTIAATDAARGRFRIVALCVVVVVLVGAGLNRYAYDAVLPRGDHWVCRESFHRTVCRNVELAELGAKDKRARRRARRNAILCTLEKHGLVRRTRGGRPWSQPRSESQA